VKPTAEVDEQDRRAQRYAGISGIAFVVLFGIGNALWAFDAPETGAPAAEILKFYSDTSEGVVIGATLSLIAVAAFVLFAATVRRILAQADGDDLLATTAFGGALLALGAGIGAESINMVGGLRAEDGGLSEALAQSLFEISQVLGTAAAGVGIAIFVSATAAVALRTHRVLPRWLALVFLLAGFSLLTPASRILEWSGAAMMLTTLTLAVALLRAPVENDRV
jgi:hypothetical protein